MVGGGGWGGGSEGWVEGSRVGRVEGKRSFEAGIRGLKLMGDTLKILISQKSTKMSKTQNNTLSRNPLGVNRPR